MTRSEVVPEILILILGIFSAIFCDFWSIVYSLLALMYLHTGRKDNDLFSPFYLFLPTLISVMFYCSEVAPYYLNVLSMTTKVYIFIGCLSFYLGMSIIRPILIRHVRQGYNLPISYNLAMPLILGTLPFVASIIIYGIPILSSQDMNDLRNSFQLPTIGMLFLFLALSILIARKQRRYFKSICLLSIFLSSLRAAKFDIALVFFFIAIAMQPAVWDKRKKALIVAAVLGLLLATPVVFELTYNLRNPVPLEQEERLFGAERIAVSVNFLPRKLLLPYLYWVTAWTNLDYYINNVDSRRGGVMTLRPIISLLRINNFFYSNTNQYIDFSKESFRPAFNTHGFLTDFYFDFGLPGLFIMPFAFGIMVNWVYQRSRSNDLALRSEYAVWGFAVLMMFFNNHFTAGYPLIAFLLFELYRILTRNVHLWLMRPIE